MSFCSTYATVRGPVQWAVEDQGIVYAIHDRGLYRIDPDNRTVGQIPLPPEIAGSVLLELGMSDGLLWVATDSVIANADARYYDWVVYGSAEGSSLPGYAGMAFEGGSVWVAGMRSLGRFDPYAEEWTRFSVPVDSLTDIASFNRQIWLSAGGGVVRFDPEYEKIRLYRCGEELPIPDVSWLHRVGDELWAMGPAGAARYVPVTESWQAVACHLAPSQLLIQGSLVWLIGGGGVSVYDLESRSCRQPMWMNRVQGRINDGTVHEGNVYLVTDQAVVVYVPSGNPVELKGDLRFPGEVDGLISLPRRVTSTGTRLVAQGDDAFAAFLSSESQWWVSPPPSGHRRGSDALIRLGDGLELGMMTPPVVISGSYTYLFQCTREAGTWDISDRHRVRLSGRRDAASAFYDNTDQFLGDRYGMQWKGPQDGFLREVGAGWGNADAELMDLPGRPGYCGGRVWVGRGERSPQRGRRLLQGRAWAGQRTTAHTEEYFEGGSASYRLTHGRIVIGTAKVYLDDQPVDEGSFTLDHTSGSFFLSFAERDLVTQDSTIRVSYDYWLPDDAEKTTLASPQLVVNHGDLWTMSVGSFHERDDGVTRSLLSGALRFRSTPDAPRSTWAEAELLADSKSGTVGSRGLLSVAGDRVQAQLSGMSLPETIETDGRTLTEYGVLEREVATSGRAEPWNELPVSWRAAWRRAGEHEGVEGGGRIVWAQRGMPTFSADVASRRWEADTLCTTWRKMELGVDYEPSSLPGFEKARGQVLVRQSTDREGDRSTRFRSGLSRVHLRPAGILDLSLLAWGRRSDDTTPGSAARLTGRTFGLLTATSTPAPGVSVYARGEADIASSDYRATTKDVALARSMLASATIRPGRAPVELEGSYSRTLSDDLDDVDRGHGLAGVLGDVGDSCSVGQQRGTTLAGGPLLFLPSQSTVRFRAVRVERTASDSGDAFSSTRQETYQVTLDMRPLSASRWFLEGIGVTTHGSGGESDTWTIYARWERRWIPSFLSRIAFNGTVTQGTSETWSWSPSLYVQVEPSTGLEVRGDLAAGRRRAAVEESFLRGSCRVEVRFLRAFLVRAEVRPEIAFPSSGGSRSGMTINLRAGATL
ncbi:hypothetical protein JXA88_09525 [Candidatus Fermentibacteria bacterium]|nr:hypothetical protein [Candidatus Fermentibacteria bacterium]